MIRVATTVVVVVLAAVAAVVSYRHILEVVTEHGESGWVAYLVPLCIDGLLVAASLVLLDTAKRGLSRHWLSWVALGTGIALTLGANVLHGLKFGPIGAVTSALPAVTLTIAFELLMGLIRRTAATARIPHLSEVEVRVPAVPAQVTASEITPANRAVTPADLRESPEVSEGEVQPTAVPEDDDPLYPLALSHFLSDVAGGEVPSVRTIKATMSVGTDRARRLQAYLGRLVEVAATGDLVQAAQS